MIPTAAIPSVLPFLGNLSVGTVTARHLVVAVTLLAVFLAFHHIRRALHQLRMADEAARLRQYQSATSGFEPAVDRQQPNNRNVWIS